MSDLISRQAAIDAINQICPIDTEYDCTLLDRVDVRCVLTDLPSAQPEPIKVSVDREMTEEELKELKKKIADSPVVLLPSAQPDMSEYSDKLWQAAYERGKAEAQPDLDEVYAHAETEAEARYHAQQRWIPCSERLPKEYGEYRITWTTSASNKRFVGDSEYEVTSEWDDEHYRFKGEWLLDDYIKNYPDVKVIAWKPLEEPYREGE